MINKLVLENLKQRWVRTLLSALLVSMQVVAILTLVGLSRGLLEDSAHRASGTGADIWLKPGGSSFSFAVGQVNQKFVRLVSRQPHVVAAVGVLTVPIGDVITMLNGVDFEEFKKMNGGFQFVAGGPPSSPDDLIVDPSYAQQHKLKVGQNYKLLNHDWRISGIMQDGKLGRLVVQLARLQDLTANADPPRVSQILVKLDDAARTDQEVKSLNALLNGDLSAISVEDLVANFSISKVPGLSAFIWDIVSVVFIVALLVYVHGCNRANPGDWNPKGTGREGMHNFEYSRERSSCACCRRQHDRYRLIVCGQGDHHGFLPVFSDSSCRPGLVVNSRRNCDPRRAARRHLSWLESGPAGCH